MTNPVRIEYNMNKGIHFSKIGANITETSQPLDVGLFFKILKMTGHNSTSIGTTSDMAFIVDKIFKKLTMDKNVILSTCKLNALKDCIISTPDMMTKAFSTRTIQKAFVALGMLDNRLKLFPDLHGLIQSFKVDWTKVEDGTMWFKKIISEAILQFYKCGEILELFYDDRKFGIDFDLKGNKYTLNSNANNMTRSTVLYHPKTLSDRRSTIKKAIDIMNEGQQKILDDAARLLIQNKECEKKLAELVGTDDDLDNKYTTFIQEILNYDTFYKCSVALLNAFIKVRVLMDLTEI